MNAPPSATPPMRPRLVAGLFLPLAAALVLRLALFALYQPWQPEVARTSVVQGDESLNHTAALNIMNGRGYSFCPNAPFTPTNLRMPGHAFLISGIYRVWGVRPWAVLVANIAFSLISLAALWLLCRMVWDSRVAAWCAWLMALCPLDIVSTQTLLRESPFLVFLAVFWLCWLWYVVRASRAALAVSALALALSAYVRDNTLYQPAFFAPLLLLPPAGGAGWRGRVAAVFLFTAVFIAALAPWSVRNHRSLGTWSLTSAGGTTMLTGNAALLLAAKHGVAYDQMLHVLHQVMLKRYVMPDPLPPEIQAALRGAYETNDALVEAVAPAWFRQTNEPHIVLRNVQEISDAQGRLFAMILRDNLPVYIKGMVLGTFRLLLTPLWQECMRITMPALDSGRFASAAARGDVAYFRSVGVRRAVPALVLAVLMTGYDVAVAVLACAGLVLLLRERRGWLFTLSWLMFGGYMLLMLTGPNAVSRLRYSLLPFLLPLAALALGKVGGTSLSRSSGGALMRRIGISGSCRQPPLVGTGMSLLP